MHVLNTRPIRMPSTAPLRPWVFTTGAVGLLMSGHLSVALSATVPSPSDETAGGNQLEEIVVTAEKRDSTVLKTAISVTAITGEQLLERGITTVEEVATQTPGISMRSGGPGQTEYELRGLASSGGSCP